MTKVYDFKTQLDRGVEAEKLVADYLDRMGFYVEEAKDMALQRKGIDYFVVSPTGVLMSVEIKTDFRAAETGNVFLETVSVEKYGIVDKLGWIYTSAAQVLVYYVTGLEEIYFVDMTAFKMKVADFKEWYREVEIKNKTYVGRGLVMPLKDFKDYVFKMVKIQDIK